MLQRADGEGSAGWMDREIAGLGGSTVHVEKV